MGGGCLSGVVSSCWYKFFGELVIFQVIRVEFRDKIMSHCSWEVKSSHDDCAQLKPRPWGEDLIRLSWLAAWLLMSWSFLCSLIIGLVMMVLPLTYFWDGEYRFSTAGIGAILGNGCGIQGQDYVALLQGIETTAGFHHRSYILCICYRLILWDVSHCPYG